MNDEELISRINDVIVEVQSVKDDFTATLSALLTFRRDFCQLATHLEQYTFNTIALSANVLRNKQQDPHSRFTTPDFPNADFVATFSSQLLATLKFLQEEKEKESEIREKVETFFRPMLARLMLITPVRTVSIPSLTTAIGTLITIFQDLLDMYQMTEKWKEKRVNIEGTFEGKMGEKEKPEGVLNFEFLLTSSLQLCHAPSYTNTYLISSNKGGKHIIARSFFIAALHTTAITLDHSLLASMMDRGIPSYIAMHEFTLSWVRTTPMMLAWDMLKTTCITRNRVLHRLTNSIIPSLGIVVTEAFMLDEQMRHDSRVQQEMTGAWNVAFATCVMTFHGDLYLQLLLEQGLIDAVEHDYVYWQWDHVLTSHMACLDRIRAMRMQIDIKMYEEWQAKVEKKKAQVAQQQLLITNGGSDNKSKNKQKAIEEKKHQKNKKNRREIDTAIAIPAPSIPSPSIEGQQLQLEQIKQELDAIMAATPPNPTIVQHNTEDFLRRGKAMLCRGIFRISLALKQLGLLADPRNEFCSKESIFNRRFALFADIVSPNALTFPDFLSVINRDALNKPQFAEQARLATEQEATFLTDLKAILQQAITMYQQARKHFDEARKHPAVPTAVHDTSFAGIDIAGLSTCTANQAVSLVKVSF